MLVLHFNVRDPDKDMSEPSRSVVLEVAAGEWRVDSIMD